MGDPKDREKGKHKHAPHYGVNSYQGLAPQRKQKGIHNEVGNRSGGLAGQGYKTQGPHLFHNGPRKYKMLKLGLEAGVSGSKKIQYVGKAKQIASSGSPGRPGHTPIQDVNKNIIHEQVAHRGNDHGHHGKFGLALCPNYRIAHHTQTQKRHPVQYNGVIGFGQRGYSALAAKGWHYGVYKIQTKRNHGDRNQQRHGNLVAKSVQGFFLLASAQGSGENARPSNSYGHTQSGNKKRNGQHHINSGNTQGANPVAHKNRVYKYIKRHHQNSNRGRHRLFYKQWANGLGA